MSGSEVRFIRFEALAGNSGFGRPPGLFQVAYELEHQQDLPPYQRASLKELLEWFERNLKTPDRFNATRSKGFYRRNASGISWFKASSGELLLRARELIHILEDNGIIVNQIVSNQPGYIVYEDEQQIVAHPFRT